MHVFELEEKDVQFLELLGDPITLAKEGIRSFTKKKVKERLALCRQKVKFFETKYDLSFEKFREKSASDEAFINALHKTHPTWEADLNAWEFYQKELEEWNKRVKKSKKEVLEAALV